MPQTVALEWYLDCSTSIISLLFNDYLVGPIDSFLEALVPARHGSPGGRQKKL